MINILDTLKNRFFKSVSDKQIQSLMPLVAQINSLESEFSALDDQALKAKTQEFKSRYQNGESLDQLLPEAFAVVRETSKRVLKMRHFDMQLLGGIVLYQGKIAEMKTGEGKTLVATLPCYLNALTEEGVYVVTVNDYLAKRDAEWMGQIHEFLGLRVGLIQAHMDTEDRAKAYLADITYGTNNEFGFDYLRDNLSLNIKDCCQLRRHFVIVDEVDSILIDEARTPLIISGPIPNSAGKYKKIHKITKSFQLDTHFNMDEKHKTISLTDEGIDEIESKMSISNIYSTETMEIAHMAVQCLKAMYLFKRDVDYVVKEGEVMIVDEFTGRILAGRRYSDGLHQAIEAIEGLSVKEESQTLASITYQNYFRLFPKIAGMTGTAKTEEEEFIKIYGMSVIEIPTNRPVTRIDEADVIYKSTVEKFNAIVKDIQVKHETGQPILVGTISIEKSETLSKLLKKAGITHEVLNAKHHEKEAEIISKAGQKHAVTIATNMAGRGTDIVLAQGVPELGGLYVIGSERHESRRIDNQLRGRSGRQGDTGRTKFYVSLDDDLMRLFGSDRIAKVMETLGLPDDTPIEHSLVSKSIGNAQKKVEQYHFSIRKQILEYDNVLDKQRNTIYTLRHNMLSHKNIDKIVQDMSKHIVSSLLKETPNFSKSDSEKAFIIEQLRQIVDIPEFENAFSKQTQSPEIDVILNSLILDRYHNQKQSIPKEIFDQIVTIITLRILDTKWMDHLHNMDALREGIGLRAYGQKNPLLEYKVEAFDFFNEMLYAIYSESLKLILHAKIVQQSGSEDLSVPQGHEPPTQESPKNPSEKNLPRSQRRRLDRQKS